MVLPERFSICDRVSVSTGLAMTKLVTSLLLTSVLVKVTVDVPVTAPAVKPESEPASVPLEVDPVEKAAATVAAVAPPTGAV